MPDVITQVIITDTREIRAELLLQPGGETLEYKIRTNFAHGREIALGSREVTIFVQFEGDETGKFPVLVTLTRPDGMIAAGRSSAIIFTWACGCSRSAPSSRTS